MLQTTYLPRHSGKTTVFCRIFAGALAALLTLGANAQNDPSTDKLPYGSLFTSSQRAPKTQARIYAYRAADTASALPINLYINGRYHASLLRGGYTEFCTTTSNWNLQTTLNDSERLHAGKLQTGTPLSPRPGQVLFLQIQDNAGRGAIVQTVSEAQALQQLRQTRLQQHTVSRSPLVEECSTELTEAIPTATTTPAKPVANPPQTRKAPPQREYALETDALFEFGKSELRPTGFNAIENLIQQVHQDYTRLDRIVVVGYSDAIGPAKLNKKLSLERARSVAERLSERGGLQAKKPIQAEGRGAEELVKTDCHNAPTPANKACHAPNRRVAIVVYGVRR